VLDRAVAPEFAKEEFAAVGAPFRARGAQRDVVARPQTFAPQELCQASRSLLELSVGDSLARTPHDHRGLVGMESRVVPGIHLPTSNDVPLTIGYGVAVIWYIRCSAL
jgi:hypothetical protein